MASQAVLDGGCMGLSCLYSIGYVVLLAVVMLEPGATAAIHEGLQVMLG